MVVPGAENLKAVLLSCETTSEVGLWSGESFGVLIWNLVFPSVLGLWIAVGVCCVLDTGCEEDLFTCLPSAWEAVGSHIDMRPIRFASLYLWKFIKFSVKSDTGNRCCVPGCGYCQCALGCMALEMFFS